VHAAARVLVAREGRNVHRDLERVGDAEAVRREDEREDRAVAERVRPHLLTDRALRERGRGVLRDRPLRLGRLQRLRLRDLRLRLPLLLLLLLVAPASRVLLPREVVPDAAGCQRLRDRRGASCSVPSRGQERQRALDVQQVALDHFQREALRQAVLELAKAIARQTREDGAARIRR
jgi:hypothetical protein